MQNIQEIVSKSLRVFGFIVTRLQSKYAEEFYGHVVPELIASGDIKYAEDVREGLESVGQALYDVSFPWSSQL